MRDTLFSGYFTTSTGTWYLSTTLSEHRISANRFIDTQLRLLRCHSYSKTFKISHRYQSPAPVGLTRSGNFSSGHGLGLGCFLVGWVGYGFLEKNIGFIYFVNRKICSSASPYSATAIAYAIRIHILPYKYPLIPPNTDLEMILVICKLIERLSARYVVTNKHWARGE